MKTRSRFITLVSITLTAWVVLALPLVASAVQFLLLPGIGTVEVHQVLVESFDQPAVWERYSSPTGVELGVEQGIYRVYNSHPGYVWGLNSQEHTSIVTEAQVTALSPFQDTGAGIMCRADVSNNGDGYYFMINANGYYSIRLGRGNEIAPLVDWQPSPAIHQGIDQNTIRAVCLDNQLAMYVNEQLVAHIVDDTYSSGYTGLAAAAGSNGVDIAFDNLILYSLQLP